LEEKMKTRFQQLLTVLIIASILLIGATQRFDTIIAKKLITTSSSGITLNGGGTLNMSSGGLTMASGDLTLTSGDATVTAGDLAVTAGNLAVGNGTPSFTQDGEDAYVEGTLEMASDVVAGARTSISVTASAPITPTGIYQPLISGALGATVNDIGAPTDDTIGKLLIVHNINATNVITIDGTGATVECKANVVLAPADTLILIWNGTDWNCLSGYDNS
jgi:hypothetical protein